MTDVSEVTEVIEVTDINCYQNGQICKTGDQMNNRPHAANV